MEIRLNDLTMIIKFSSTQEEKMIKKFITFKDDKSAFFGGKFHSEKVKNVCMGKDIKGYFVCFAGLCKEIMIFCKKNNINISSFEDKRAHFDFQKKEWTHDELRKYFNPNFKYVEHQIRALQAMINTNTGIIKAATSAGKSHIMLAFMKLTKLPTLILTDRATLGAQLAEDFNKNGIDCGFCSGKGVKDGYCMVSTIQSVKKIPNLEKFKCILSDEVHKDSSKTFQDFLAQFGCPLKFGFTASPYNGNYLDYAKIRQFFGSVIIEIKADELIKNEVMSKPHIYLVESHFKNEDDCFDYNSAYEEGIVNNESRNKSIIKIVSRYKKGVAILVSRLEHGKLLEEKIEGSVFVSGYMPVEQRLDILKKFNDGEIRCIIGSNVLNEGISITNMFCLIQAAGMKAMTQTVQRIGRCLRSSATKKDADFYDFIDYNKFLSKHSKQRIRLYKQECLAEDVKLLDENLEEIKK